MNKNCSCGGRLRRLDVVAEYSTRYKRTMYRDTNSTVARFKCEKCGKVYSQRKRQSTKGVQVKLPFNEWIAQVEGKLKGQWLYEAALATGTPTPHSGVVEMRGDEPEGEYDAGKTPEEYVKHLISEWALYGPSGE